MELKITPSGQTIVKPTALGPVANTDSKLLIYGLFQKGRVLAQDDIEKPWENDDLRLIIRNGLEKRILLKRLEDQIAEVNKAHDELMNVQKEILKAFA